MKIIVSSCLLGNAVRYDGTYYLNKHPLLELFKQEGQIIVFCPEVEGGLPIPRDPAEIDQGDGKDVRNNAASVLSNKGDVLTSFFIEGTSKLEAICRSEKIGLAILKDRSPSCGVHEIYDGTFRGKTKPGMGVATALLKSLQIPLFSETEIQEAYEYWKTLDASKLS